MYPLSGIGNKNLTINFVLILPTCLLSVHTTAVSALSEGGNNEGVSQSTLILIILAAIGGLILLVVLLVFILTRFYR